MPESNQLTFSHKEVVELLVKEAKVHEGYWRLLINFNISAGNFGQTEQDANPGIQLLVTKIGIHRAESESPDTITIDAGRVNPKPRTARKTKSRSKSKP